jgi:hypothetical protein
MNGITFDQIRGPVERILYVALGWLVARGYISSDEVANYVTLALGIGAAFYGWWQNTPRQIARSAAAIPGTTVVAPADIALNTSETNILSAQTNSVTPNR